MQLITIPNVRITTKDNVSISIDNVIYYYIVDPFISTYAVANAYNALMERAQTTVRTVLGQKTLQEIIENREGIAQNIEHLITEPSESWGLKVEAVLIKDIEFSKELQESLSSAAQARRIGESKVIQAQAEVDAAKLMREAADILNSEAAMQIRYLDTMHSMSKSAGSKVIFLPYNSNTPGVDKKSIVDNGTMMAAMSGV